MGGHVLTTADIAGAISELSERSELSMSAISQLASEYGYVSRNAAPNLEEQVEIMRLSRSNPRMFRQDESASALMADEIDLSDPYTQSAEILRLSSTYSRELGARPSRSDSQTLALTAGLSGTDSRIVTALRVRGLPADTLAGSSDPIGDLQKLDQGRRAALARTLPMLVVDSDADSSTPEDGGGYEYRYQPTPSLGVNDDGTDPDLGVGPGSDTFGQPQSQVITPDGASYEVSRIVRTYAKDISSLRAGAARNRHPATGRFTSKVPMPAAVTR
jgi:hypothetical protein